NEIRANKSGTAGNQDTHIIPFVGQFLANSTRNCGVRSQPIPPCHNVRCEGDTGDLHNCAARRV
ncbi:hypothetical protein QP112_07790, partial [Actinotignum timonense]|uniref:hypothetical protein n=1 Tax=Actinotignum timonense TaxID=1870995 RepID=UPI0025502F38